MILSRKHIVLILAGLCIMAVGFTQTTVKLVTRKIEQKWETKEGCQIFIAADKARIKVEQSEGNTLEVELKLISKHANLDVAKKEVLYLKYSLTEKGNDYYLNNNILLPKKTASADSRLTAIYTIKAPKECRINITNMLGNTTLSNLNNQVDISISYGNLYVNNCTGKLNVRTKVGDIEIKNSDINAELFTEYSEINMDDINGNIKIQARFGNINLVPGKQLETLMINANKTDVYVFNEYCTEYSLDVNADHGVINTSEGCYIKSKNVFKTLQHNGKTTQLNYPKTGNTGSINIKTKFSDVNLR